MRTLLTHFYNEEYLLPWWLKHHLDLFDHGILVDYQSTDRSVEIIRDLAPRWTILSSMNTVFDSALCDLEMTWIEKDIPGWKIILNVSEFLVLDHGTKTLDAIELFANTDINKPRGLIIPGCVMADNAPEIVPNYNRPLVEQKHFGFNEIELDVAIATKMKHLPFPSRSRMYHKAPIGVYMPGRHQTHMPDVTNVMTSARVFWYGFSPWTANFINRKLQISPKVSDTDKKIGGGIQHLMTLEQLTAKKDLYVKFSRQLEIK